MHDSRSVESHNMIDVKFAGQEIPQQSQSFHKDLEFGVLEQAEYLICT
jgi:hypothetical protein